MNMELQEKEELPLPESKAAELPGDQGFQERSSIERRH
jgi:hypothetical protein